MAMAAPAVMNELRRCFIARSCIGVSFAAMLAGAQQRSELQLAKEKRHSRSRRGAAQAGAIPRGPGACEQALV